MREALEPHSTPTASELKAITDEIAGHSERDASQEDIESAQKRVEAAVNELAAIETFAAEEDGASADDVVGDYVGSKGHPNGASQTIEASAHELAEAMQGGDPEAKEIQQSWENRTPGENIRMLVEAQDLAFHAAKQRVNANANLYMWQITRQATEQVIEEIASRKMIGVLEEIPPAQLLQMRQLEGGENESLSLIIDRCTAHHMDYGRASRLDARLSGHESIRDKFLYQQQTGEIDGRQVRPLDMYGDIPDSAGDEVRKAFAAELLTEHLGYEDDAAAELIVAMSGRVAKSPTVELETRDLSIDKNKHILELRKVSSAVETIGSDNVKKLREKCGIVNVGNLSPAQLQRMVRFADGDPVLLEQLRQKEVCVILLDATLDWNGSLSDTSNAYATNQESELIFEVSSTAETDDQIHRYVKCLKDNSVQASVLVITAHGGPGYVRLGDTKMLTREPDNEQPADDKYTHLEKSGLLALICNMKPDRDGNCTVIFDSCSQDGPLRHEDDTTLTRTADIIQGAGTGKTYSILGTKGRSSLKMDSNGRLLDSSRRQDVSRVTVTASGNVYRHLAVIRPPTLPMFGRPGEQIDPGTEHDIQEVSVWATKK